MTTGLCVAWLVAVALIVLWPTPVDHNAAGTLRRGLGFLHRNGFPPFITYDFVEFTSNVLMFVPFGLFWFVLAPYRWRWWGPVAGFTLSVLIEVTQLVLLPQRFATPYDVLANTMGTLVGVLIGWGHLRFRGPRRVR